MPKPERFQLALTKEDYERLQKLADENSATNKSYLVRQLIEMAWNDPDKFGLRVPKASALALGMSLN